MSLENEADIETPKTLEAVLTLLSTEDRQNALNGLAEEKRLQRKNTEGNWVSVGVVIANEEGITILGEKSSEEGVEQQSAKPATIQEKKIDVNINHIPWNMVKEKLRIL
ncbi:hypothetical protein IPG41_01415 [Candidatus Peregrinibacteria bacterium]|nr:MAG: hypothetical protein IPG41_01415 [Candidatus Peregrinibacteria bacterium]